MVRTTQVREHRNKELHKTLDPTNGLQPKRLQARGDLFFQAKSTISLRAQSVDKLTC